MLQDGRVILTLITLLFIIIVIILGIRNERNTRKELFTKIKKDYGRKRNVKACRIELLNHHKEALTKGYYVDSITAGDMEINRIFASINHTSSSLGQEYLYYQLLRGRLDKDELDSFEELMLFFHDNEEVRNNYRYQYERLGKKTSVDIDRFLSGESDKKKAGYFKHFLGYALLIIAIVFYAFNVVWPGTIAMLLFLIVSISTYFKEKTDIHIFLDSAFYIVKLVDIGKNIASIGGKGCNKLSEIIEDISKKNNVIDKALIGSKYVFLSAPANTSFLSSIVLYINLFFHFDILLYYSLERRVRVKSQEIVELYDLVGFIEAALAVDSYRESLELWCKPSFDDDKKLCLIEELYHPLINEPVRNNANFKKSMLITGANASGKSTYLRALGTATIMAQTINTVCAKKYSLPFYRVYSSMSLKDSLQKGDSYFMTEIKAIKRILDEASHEGDTVLCLVDEVLRGTNTIERIAAASQVIRYLIEHRVICVFATHDMELSQLLNEYLNNYHFEEAEQTGSADILFTYKLMDGPTNSKNAIRLLANLGIDGDLVNKAKLMAGRFENTGDWSLD